MISGNVGYSNWENQLNYATFSTFKNQSHGLYYMGGLKLGYYVSNNFAIGLYSNCYTNKSNSTYYNSWASTSVQSNSSSANQSLGIFARYHHLFFENKFGVLFQTYIGSNWGKWNTRVLQSNPVNGDQITVDAGKSNSQNINLTAGLIYFINKKFSIETSLGGMGYGIDHWRSTHTLNNSKTTGGWIGLSSNINFAFTYYFGYNKQQN